MRAWTVFLARFQLPAKIQRKSEGRWGFSVLKAGNPNLGCVCIIIGTNTMAPRKQKDVLGELVWVLEGKTEHPANLLPKEPPVVAGGIRYLWIKFSTNGKKECVQETAVKREEASFGRRSQRATRTNGKDHGESQRVVKKDKEEIKKAPAHNKRSKRQQEGRPGKQARTEKTAGNLASLDAEDSLASASHSALAEKESQGCKKKIASASPQLYKRSPGLQLTGQSQATNTAGIVASPPKAASRSVSNIEKNDSICTKEHGWVKVIGHSFSSPRKGNHPTLFQIEWKDEDETILKGYVSEGNITEHIPHGLLADASKDESEGESEDESEETIDLLLEEEALRTADELYRTADSKTTTLSGITMLVLEACNIEDDMEHYDLYCNIIKTRIYELVRGKEPLEL
jgi:hypothetical protein